MLTEQPNPATQDIDRLPTLELLRVINEEEQKIAPAVAKTLPEIARAVDAIVARFRRGGRLFYVGAGTSGRLGILDAVECPPTFGVSHEMVQGIIAGGQEAILRSSEGAEDNFEAGRQDLLARNISEVDAVVGIAASGRTPYVLGAIQAAGERRAMTIGLACNRPSALLEAVELAIGVETGPEVIAGSTRMKAGTATKMVLNMLSAASMTQLGKVYGNLMVDVQPTNEKLVHRARRIIQSITGLDGQDAAELLERSGKDVKVAIVMARRNVNAQEARELLRQANGYLRAVIG